MNQADLIIKIALGEDGYLEKKSNDSLYDKTANSGYNNYTKYGLWYQENVDNSYKFINAAWCDMFKTWCANVAGVKNTQIPYTAKCETGVNWFKKRGLWKNPTGYTPKKGDIIYYTDNNGLVCHVGFVTGISGGYVNTIEGNTSKASGVIVNGGGVTQKKYLLSYNRILGYGTPLYTDSLSKEEVKSLIRSTAPSIIKAEIDKYINNRKGIKVPSPWARKDGSWENATSAKLTDGSCPRAFITREEFISIVLRYIEASVK